MDKKNYAAVLILLAALAAGCNKDEYSVVHFAEYSLEGTSCTWTIPYPFYEERKPVIINSHELLLKFLRITGNIPYPAIDFTKNSIVLLSGDSYYRVSPKRLRRFSNGKYELNFEIRQNEILDWKGWIIALITDKIADGSEIDWVLSIPDLDKHPVTLGKEIYGIHMKNLDQKSFVIKNKAEWNDLKEMIIKYLAVVGPTQLPTVLHTKIDFTKYQVIAVFDKFTSGGRSVDITDISEYQDEIVVTVENLTPARGTQEGSHAWHIVMIPHSPKKIRIQETDIPISEYVPFWEGRYPCQWRNLPYNNKLLFIENNEQLGHYVTCDNGEPIPMIHGRLILASGRTQYFIFHISKKVQMLSPNEYTVQIDITLDRKIAKEEFWSFAFAFSTNLRIVNQNTTYKLNVNIK